LLRSIPWSGANRWFEKSRPNVILVVCGPDGVAVFDDDG
jgi:hypothetical protein